MPCALMKTSKPLFRCSDARLMLPPTIPPRAERGGARTRVVEAAPDDIRSYARRPCSSARRGAKAAARYAATARRRLQMVAADAPIDTRDTEREMKTSE